MTIISVEKMWSRTSTSYSVDKSRKRTIQINEAYQVIHSADATELEILSASGLPRLDSTYPGTTSVFLDTFGSTEKKGLVLTIVPITYNGETGPSGVTDSAVNTPPKIKMVSASSTEPIDIDGYGFPITNTVGEPVEGISKEINDWVLTVQRNFASFNTSTLNQYLDSVNSDLFGFAPLGLWLPGTIALKSIELEPMLDGRDSYVSAFATFNCRVPYNTVPARAHWARYRNEGFYERTGTSVTFTGGGGTGAAAYVITNSSGVITNVVVTNRGRDYTSAPTVAFGSPGTGATATAVINPNGEVTSVTVGSGGSNYKSKVVRAVDDNKEPMTKPVLLKANGTREPNAGSAFFIERPKKSYLLPYSALGFL